MLDVRGNFVEYNFFVNNSSSRRFTNKHKQFFSIKKLDWITVLGEKASFVVRCHKIIKITLIIKISHLSYAVARETRKR